MCISIYMYIYICKCRGLPILKSGFQESGTRLLVLGLCLQISSLDVGTYVCMCVCECIRRRESQQDGSGTRGGKVKRQSECVRARKGKSEGEWGRELARETSSITDLAPSSTASKVNWAISLARSPTKHTYTHTHTRTYAHTHTRTHTHTHARARKRVHRHADMQKDT